MFDARIRIAEFLQRSASKVAADMGHDAILVRWVRPLYDAALGWMASDRGVTWSINGVDYRIDIRHRHLLAHEYESGVAAFLSRLIQPGFVCFDVGANVGAYVLQFCHWAGPSGRVVAFEPNPDTRGVLERHIAMNRFRERVQVVPAAVGACEGEAAFYAAGTDGMSRLQTPNPALASQSRRLTVPILTLDGFVQDSGNVPDLVLVDVEGFEAAVLEGTRNLLEKRRNALHLIVEIHPSLWPAANTDRGRVEALLDELKLEPKSLTGQRDPLGEYGLVYLQCR
jgi:FkbM family methyltransferase